MPLHDSPAGLRDGRALGTRPITVCASEHLVRLPLWVGLGDDLDRVVVATDRALRAPDVRWAG